MYTFLYSIFYGNNENDANDDDNKNSHPQSLPWGAPGFKTQLNKIHVNMNKPWGMP